MTRLVFLGLFVLVTASCGKSKKPFEGTITYTIDLRATEDMPAEVAELVRQMLLATIPNRITIAYRGSKMRSEWGEEVHITDAEARTDYLLQLSKKTFRKFPLAGADKASIRKSEEKTTILGHTVEKYILELPEAKVDKKAIQVEVWVAPDLEVNEVLASISIAGMANTAPGMNAQIRGLPLRIDIPIPNSNYGTMLFTFQATELSNTPPDPNLFEVPGDYTESF